MLCVCDTVCFLSTHVQCCVCDTVWFCARNYGVWCVCGFVRHHEIPHQSVQRVESDLCLTYQALVVITFRLGLPDNVSVFPHLLAPIIPFLACGWCIVAALRFSCKTKSSASSRTSDGGREAVYAPLAASSAPLAASSAPLAASSAHQSHLHLMSASL